MRYLTRFIISFIAIAGLLAGLLLMAVMRQPDVNAADESYTFYYLAPDENDTLQLWQYDQDATTLLTDSAAHVTQYAIADDNSAIAYVSDAQLWYDDLTDDAPSTALTALVMPDYGEYAYGYPAISQDKSTVVFSNGGLYKMSTSGGVPQLLLEDIGLDVTQPEGPPAVRVYRQATFIDNDTLLLTVGIWESTLPAVYDLRTDTYIETDPYSYEAADIISNQRLLYYSSSFRGMAEGVFIAPVENPAATQLLINRSFGDTLPTEGSIVFDTVEIEPGKVRLLTSWIPTDPAAQGMGYSVIDYTIDSGVIDVVYSTQTQDAGLAQLNAHHFTPDGNAIIGVLGAEYQTDFYQTGNLNGQPTVYDIASDSVRVLTDATVMSFTAQ